MSSQAPVTFFLDHGRSRIEHDREEGNVPVLKFLKLRVDLRASFDIRCRECLRIKAIVAGNGRIALTDTLRQEIERVRGFALEA